MTWPIMPLSMDELWSALEEIDPIAVLVDELVSRDGESTGWGWQRPGRFTMRRHDRPRIVDSTFDLVIVEDARMGVRCVLPAAALRSVRLAALASLAARRLLNSGVVTAAVLGSGAAAELHLAVIARCVPGISHVTVCAGNGLGRLPVGTRVLDQLDLAGIGLSVTDNVDQAVRGANFVSVVGPEPGELRIGQLAKGAVAVNSLVRSLPKDLTARFDQIYVDDARLLEANPHRNLVLASKAGCGLGVGRTRRRAGRDSRRPVESDLGWLLTGAHPGRTRVDDVLLVELLSTHVLSAELACQLHRAGMRRDSDSRKSC